MRGTAAAIILLVIFFALGCESPAPVNPPDAALDYAKIDTKEIVKSLEGKTEWQTLKDICPSELVPERAAEIDFTENLCAQNPGECFKRCTEESGSACLALALLLQKTEGLKQPYSEVLFSRACKLGIASGCTNRAAGKLNSEKKSLESESCILETFEKSCALGDPWGCTMHGFLLWEGEFVKKDASKAIVSLKKACALDDTDSGACLRSKDVQISIAKSDKNEKNS